MVISRSEFPYDLVRIYENIISSVFYDVNDNVKTEIYKEIKENIGDLVWREVRNNIIPMYNTIQKDIKNQF